MQRCEYTDAWGEPCRAAATCEHEGEHLCATHCEAVRALSTLPRELVLAERKEDADWLWMEGVRNITAANLRRHRGSA